MARHKPSPPGCPQQSKRPLFQSAALAIQTPITEHDTRSSKVGCPWANSGEGMLVARHATPCQVGPRQITSRPLVDSHVIPHHVTPHIPSYIKSYEISWQQVKAQHKPSKAKRSTAEDYTVCHVIRCHAAARSWCAFVTANHPCTFLKHCPCCLSVSVSANVNVADNVNVNISVGVRISAMSGSLSIPLSGSV